MVTPFTPPPTFIQIDSMVDGISVYGPQQNLETFPDQLTFKCPNCGAVIGYDVSIGGVSCEHCGFSAPANGQIVGDSEKANEFTLDALKKYEMGWGTKRRVLHCHGCGAELSISDTALSITCPFCASNKVVIQSLGSDSIRPRHLIPFQIQSKDTIDKARQWLSQGWFHPKNLAALASMDRFFGIYLPFWVFDAQINAIWRAEVGYEHEERYFDHADKEWRTRTVINWVWKNGEVPLFIDNLLVTGTSHVSHTILGKLLPFDLNNLMKYAPDFLAGWQAKAYDLDLPTSWENGKITMREKAKEACYSAINSSHIRNFSMLANFADESWRYILLPVYMSAYKFESKVFQVMINGQTGVIAGQKPVEWLKIWLVIAALLSPGGILCLIGLPLLIVGGFGIIPLVVGLILMIIGGFLSIRLYHKAIASEAG